MQIILDMSRNLYVSGHAVTIIQQQIYIFNEISEILCKFSMVNNEMCVSLIRAVTGISNGTGKRRWTGGTIGYIRRGQRPILHGWVGFVLQLASVIEINTSDRRHHSTESTDGNRYRSEYFVEIRARRVHTRNGKFAYLSKILQHRFRLFDGFGKPESPCPKD